MEPELLSQEATAWQMPVDTFDPAWILESALNDVRMDFKAPTFKEEQMIQAFKNIAASTKVSHTARERFSNFLTMLKEHKFWDTQPVVPMKGKIYKEGQIQKFKQDDTPKEPVDLPAGFHWSTLDLSNDADLQEFTTFINAHYIECESGDFRVQYTKEKL